MKQIITPLKLKRDYKTYKKIFLKSSPEKQKNYHQEMLSTLPILEAERVKSVEKLKQKFNLDTDSLNEIADFIMLTADGDAFIEWMKFCLNLFEFYNEDPENFDLFASASILHEERGIQRYIAEHGPG
jgi:hypothetical protein